MCYTVTVKQKIQRLFDEFSYVYVYVYQVCLNMKMSNRNLFKKTFFKKTSYISVCSKTFLRLCYKTNSVKTIST